MASTDATPRQIYLEEISAASSQETLARAQELLLEYGRFVLAQPGAGRFCFGTLEKEAAGLPASYHEQGGGCLIAFMQDEPAAFVAWRSLPATVAPNACEMKRLWVRPASRGLLLGRTLTLAVLDRARAGGCKAVYLDTAPASMAAAHRMYLGLGFEPCAPYNDNPVEGLVYLRKNL
ncbi:MAG TPA: GNAT family N-acetyltransferase [Terracidiphilus sp.]|nr:GNAT family N-acetyltransferase [Terracidiphilus sp.]